MSKSGVTYINPPSAPPVLGMYSHVARMAPGELAFIAGQVAVDAKGNPVGVGDLAAQVKQVFANLGGILKDLGTDFESVVQFTTYLTKAENIPAWMAARGDVSQAFPGRQIPAQHPAGDRPPGETRVPAGDRGDRAGAGVTGLIPCLPWQLDLGLLHVCQLRCQVDIRRIYGQGKPSPRSPVGRCGEPDEIASCVCFLASTLAANLTDTVIAG